MFVWVGFVCICHDNGICAINQNLNLFPHYRGRHNHFSSKQTSTIARGGVPAAIVVYINTFYQINIELARGGFPTKNKK